MESFFRTHNHLIEHLPTVIRRELMDEIDWSQRLIGIKGSRGVGKTTFLLQYAKEVFGADNRECLYVNLNHFYFSAYSIVDFANEFQLKGGKVLLLDQLFKYPSWSEELRICHDRFPSLQIVFTGSSVMRLKEENPYIGEIVDSYNLRGFSFREYLQIKTQLSFPSYSLEEILVNHTSIAEEITSQVKPLAYFQDYLHHGYYPFFLEKRNFSENLLKTMNMILEVDILLIQQIEQSYLTKLKRLFYILYTKTPSGPNVSQLSKEIETSRATVTNYMKYITDGRLINQLYASGDSFPKKPAKVYMQNPNLLYPISPMKVQQSVVCETFFYNQVLMDNDLHSSNKADFMVTPRSTPETHYHFKILQDLKASNAHKPDTYLAVEKIEVGKEQTIPLWLFGFLY